VTDDWLAGARVDAEVFALRPDYRALLLLAEDLVPGPSDDVSDKLLADAGCSVPLELPDPGEDVVQRDADRHRLGHHRVEHLGEEPLPPVPA
jgi:hypothetical protein